MSNIDFFLKKPIFTFVVMLILSLIGIHAVTNLNIESLPEVNAPVIYAAVPLPGGAPEEVEMLVTNPLEEKIGEIEDLNRLVSSSWENVSIIVAFFDEQVDQEEKFKEFRQKVAEARDLLLEETMDPIIEEISFENLPMMFVGFSGGDRSQYELSRYATGIKKELEAVKGVKKVVMTGATDRRVEIDLDPAALKKYGADPLKLLIEDLGNINTNMPGGKKRMSFSFGMFKMPEKEYSIRTIGKFDGIDDLRRMVVASDEGAPVHLSDIAGVGETYPDPATIVHLDGNRGVSLGIMKKRGYGTLNVADRLKKVLSKYDDVVIMSDDSAFIRHQMTDLRNHALWGCCLVLIILFVALGFRMAAIVTFAVPMSFFMTFIAMYYHDMTINMVTLFSMLLALGMMVDNSIVVCENIFRHRGLGKDAYHASLDGTTEVSWPIFSSTGAIVAAFLPMAIFLTGPIGEFTRPISIVVTFALVSSLIVANFFNPIMCETFVKKAPREDREDKDGFFIRRAKKGYGSIISWCLDHGFAVMAAALVLLTACVLLVALKVIGLQLFPQLDTAKIYIDVKTPPGTTLEETTEAVAKIENLFKESGYVDHYITNIGSSGTRVEIDDHIYRGSNIARIIVDLKPRNLIDRPHKQVIGLLRQRLESMFNDGTEINFIEKVLGPPVGSPINIQISGRDYEHLRAMTESVNEMLESEPGVIDLKDDLPGMVPQLLLRVNHEALGLAGMTTRDIGGLIFLSLTGYRIGDMVLDGEKEDIFLKIDQDKNADPMAMYSSSFTLPDGSEMKLSELLKPKPTQGLSAVEHENGRRTVTIEAGVEKGFEAKRIVDSLKKRIPEKQAELAAGDPGIAELDISFAGENMLIDTAVKDLSTALFVSIALIYLILLLEFRSTTQPLIILVCVPYALVGVIVGLLIMRYSFSILSGIGLLCLIGIVVNNGIIYIDYANLLQDRGMGRRKACIEACLTRLRPIVLTKLTVILGIMPLALSTAAKTQFWKPLCWAIIWGLLIATTLTLVIIPVAYYITEGWRRKYYKNHSEYALRGKDGPPAQENPG